MAKKKSIPVREGRKFSPLELAAHQRLRDLAKARRKTSAQRRAEAGWLVKVPSQLEPVSHFFESNPGITVEAVAKALDVSERTVQRWLHSGGPRLARLALFWLSLEGMSFWDAELHSRFVVAVQTNQALWREVRQLREQASRQLVDQPPIQRRRSA